jgi:enediyne biosynthesis thioesterase
MNVREAVESRAGEAPAFVYRHVVSFEETNVVGNVYFSRHVAWQGRCREMFLKRHAPEILDEIYRDLRLVTLRVSCEYFEEFHALDDVEIHMRLEALAQHRISLRFDYHLLSQDRMSLVAVGHQDIGCMRMAGEALAPVAPPQSLIDALRPYMARRS